MPWLQPGTQICFGPIFLRGILGQVIRDGLERLALDPLPFDVNAFRNFRKPQVVLLDLLHHQIHSAGSHFPRSFKNA